MRIAVLCDIHGVLPALEAVLAEPDVRSADRVVLGGDLAAGPQPVGTLDVLRALGDRAVWVRGNADRELVEIRAGKAGEYAVSRWAAAQLRPDQVDQLAGLPTTVTVGHTLFCHATPRRDDEVVLVDSPPARWAEVFSTLDDSVAMVVCGHTHMPYVRLVDRRVVVNPGSVGMPYGRAGAHWALIDGATVSLHVTRFDVERVVTESSYPDAPAWADEYLREPASDIEALTVFSQLDQRGG
jgi:predicted phosphodiesterase